MWMRKGFSEVLNKPNNKDLCALVALGALTLSLTTQIIKLFNITREHVVSARL